MRPDEFDMPTDQETDRSPRDSESREATQRTSDEWKPAAILPVPKPEDGWAFRWIRTSSYGQADNKNVSKKYREGWQPVRAEDYEYLQVMSDIDSQFDGNIEVGGLLLCKAPIEWIKKRRQYYANMNDQQMQSVDNSLMRESDPRMPMLQPDRKSRTSFRGS